MILYDFTRIDYKVFYFKSVRIHEFHKRISISGFVFHSPFFICFLTSS